MHCSLRPLLAAAALLSCVGPAAAQHHCPLHGRRAPNCGGATYSAPASTYSAPAATYSAPAVSAPAVTYTAPAATYTAPATTFIAQQPVAYTVQQPITYTVQQPTTFAFAAPQATAAFGTQTCGGPSPFGGQASTQGLAEVVTGIGSVLDLLDRVRGPRGGSDGECCGELRADLAALERRVDEGFRDADRADRRLYDLTEEEFRRAKGRLDRLEIRDSTNPNLPTKVDKTDDFNISDVVETQTAAQAAGADQTTLQNIKTSIDGLRQEITGLKARVKDLEP